MDLGVDGRVALVMGASRGIGNGIARALAREGAQVAIASRSAERAAAAANEIPGEVRGFAADTGDLEGLTALPGQVATALGPVEILITNTGGPPVGEALGADLDAWRQAYDHLVLAPRVLIEAALGPMRERAGAESSTSARARPRNRSKAWRCRTLTGVPPSASSRPWRARWPATGSRSTMSPPGASPPTGWPTTGAGTSRWSATQPRGSPPGRLGQPAEYGDLVAFLCSERAAYITGASIPIDGGMLRSI